MTAHSEEYTKSQIKNMESKVKTTYISTFKNIQKWMDTMQLKLNLDKTKYIQFASTKCIKKLGYLPFNANGDLIRN